MVAESGEAWEVRCSSAPSSVAVMGVGMSLLGDSMSSGLAGLRCGSVGDGATPGSSCGGGVGCCMGTSGAESTVAAAVEDRAAFMSRPVGRMRTSSGGQVERPAMLSCSTGETIASSGVGIVRGVGWGESLGTRELITHGTGRGGAERRECSE